MSGHGKGALDGVGVTLKRTADHLVARGQDIPNLDSFLDLLKSAAKNVIIEEVQESGMFEKELLIPTLPDFRGSMKIHQILWDVAQQNRLTMRKLSCSLDGCFTSAVECEHGLHLGFYNIDEINTPITPKRSKVVTTENQRKEPEIELQKSYDRQFEIESSDQRKVLMALDNVDSTFGVNNPSHVEPKSSAIDSEIVNVVSGVSESFWHDIPQTFIAECHELYV